ncbi:Flp family type IVb pilin [Anaerosporomusa subterranea]|jgi:Flp pilus assembly pilin Flp|uniref:Flp family type IVb pilin n=1 Tax=Anaerosporomusa subterranea TaxID=1794912 RepID=UPI0012E7B092|nr:Flp family type IVb pilin [Anaerosporomusa subterranea]
MRWFNKLEAVFRDQCGQGLVEYNLVLIIISLIAIAALTIIGNFLPNVLPGALAGALQ